MTWNLMRHNGEVCIESKGDIVPVKIMWARPFSARHQEIAIVSKKGVALAHLDSISDLEPEEQIIAKEELKNRYFLAIITKIYNIEAIFGSYHWHVETDKGQRKFILKNVNRNLIFINKDYIIIHDHAGNYYEIPDLQKLNNSSIKQLHKVTI